MRKNSSPSLNVNLKQALSHYSLLLSDEFEEVSPFLKKGAVISPFSLWVLLALTLRVSRQAYKTRTEYVESVAEESLLMSLDDACVILDRIPSSVRLAFGAWGGEAYKSWLVVAERFMPVGFNIPDKAELDEWVNENTDGLIPSFPLDVSSFKPDVILANALVSDLKWVEPFDSIPSSTLSSEWNVETLLSKTWNNSNCFRLVEDSGSKFLRFIVKAEDGKSVLLYIPESSKVGMSAADLYSLMVRSFDIDGGYIPEDGFLLQDFGWGFSEVIRSETNKFEVSLPAWEVDSSVELSLLSEVRAVTDTAFPDSDMEGVQVAKAKFGKEGFTAAAVNALMMRASGVPRVSEKLKHNIMFSPGFGFVVVEENLPLFVGYVGFDDAINPDD